ncbi:FAD-binding oxidoreductase [Pseudodesulfovibrio sp.]|uniref:FAD-binding oxidoreductase n=1 Tax=unclassified Pseudodesulfovibrio TaxID=2661612 RepID=UPI003AFF71AE
MNQYAPSLTQAHQQFLSDLFPGEGCLLSPEERAAFSADSSRCHAMPWAVVRPENRDQVIELLRWAEAEHMPLYPRARGTCQVGNAVPSLGGVVISLLRMNRILDVNADDFAGVVEPGVVTADFQAACAAKQVFYPPDPASVKMSTVIGNASTCAGGLRAVKYGVTRDWVLGLEAVLPGGKVLRTGGRMHKDVVGLDLTRLFVGACGKLGLITEMTVKLIPLPEASASVLVGFADLAACMEGARAVFRAGLLPAACEFMDETVLKAVRKIDDVPLPETTRAALLFKVDGTAGGVRAETELLCAALKPLSPVGMMVGTGDEEEAVWTVRRRISPATFQIRPNKVAEDIAVPRSRVGEAAERVHAIGREFGLPVLCYGHLGDGNLHVSIMHDVSVPGEVEAAGKAKTAVFRLAIELGGTISGEHGTGLTKAEFVAEQLSAETIALMDGIKRNFDPSGIMNPGKAW